MSPFIGVILLRLSGKINFPVMAAYGLGTGSLVLYAVHTGGIISPVMPYLLSNLAILSAVGSAAIVAACFSLTLLVLISLAIAGGLGALPANVLPAAEQPLILFVSFSTACAMIALSAVGAARFRKQSKDRLGQTQELFSRTFQSSPNLMALVNPTTGEHFDVNKAWLSTIGFTREEVVGQTSFELGQWADVNDRNKMLNIHKENGRVRDFVAQLKTNDGRIIDCSFSTEPIKINRLELVLWTIVDITERKRVDDALKAALVDAERANQVKSEFLATMSHEFRTPLNAILGFSELMRDEHFGALGSDRYREYASDIHHSGQHMLALVNDVLDIATIEAGKRILTKELIATEDILRACLKKVAKAAEDGGITLSFDVADNLPPLFADARSVTQIVLNLLSNATKFTKPGGTVSLSAGSRGGQIVISVKDTGIGIPPDKLKVITEPFSQASSNPHNAQEGTGLGLSIVASLVEAHDGELRIESDIGTGTAVSVTFPFSEAAARLIAG